MFRVYALINTHPNSGEPNTARTFGSSWQLFPEKLAVCCDETCPGQRHVMWNASPGFWFIRCRSVVDIIVLYPLVSRVRTRCDNKVVIVLCWTFYIRQLSAKRTNMFLSPLHLQAFILVLPVSVLRPFEFVSVFVSRIGEKITKMYLQSVVT